jgi:hypothetical protein
MSDANIEYREFYDVPRVFLVEYKQQLFLFESPFDEGHDEYSETYSVYVMRELTKEERQGSWEQISEKAVRKVGEVRVSDVKFDSTLRRAIDTSLLDHLVSVMKS